MTKEQQKEAARRILAKCPLTPEEELRFKMVSRTPDEYDRPGQVRTCGSCGATFEDTLDGRGEVKISALEKFSDHQAEHNPSPAQWTEAYNRIQASKQRPDM